MVQSSIWRDIYYTATGTGYTVLSYYINVDSSSGQTIFRGKAYALPDSNEIRVNISRNCADYLSNELYSLNNGTYTNPLASRYFYLYDSNGNLLETYLFSYDWSYEVNPSSLTSTRYAVGQKIVETVTGTTGYTNTVSTFSGATEYCGRYALIYLEPSGKWGSYLIEGAIKITDKLNAFNTERSFNNQSIEFGKNKYVNELTTSYELNTSWLSDAESEIFAKNVVRSIKVYLQDIEKSKIIPVVITDTSVERKTYKNEKKLISYKLTVEESQNKEIR